MKKHVSSVRFLRAAVHAGAHSVAYSVLCWHGLGHPVVSFAYLALLLAVVFDALAEWRGW